jgi:acetate---CoA ligase (ADP-forming)
MPKGIAIVGASARNFWSRAAIANLNAYKFDGPIWPVNPNYAEVDGLHCYPSLRDLPGQAELALVAVASEKCASVVADAVEAAIPHIVVISDGFAERGRQDLQDELVALVEGSTSNLYGPNCVGFLDLAAGLCAVGEPIPTNLRQGPVSFISQSGAFLSAFMSASVEDGFGVDWCISLGNGAHVDVGRAVGMAVARPTTQVVCLYAESLGSKPSALGAAMSLARELGKWVIVLKVGASDRGSQIAFSHTASMVGPDHLVSSFLEGHGAVRADGMEELVRLASICSIVEGRPTGGVAIIGSSGGTAGIASDTAQRVGLHLAEFASQTVSYLRENAPPGSFIDNPVDITGRPGARVGIDAMWRQVFKDPNVSFVVAPVTLVYPDEAEEQRAGYREAMLLYRQLAAECNKPTASVSLGIQTWTAWVERIRDSRSPNYILVRGLGTTLNALAKIFPAAADTHAKGREAQLGSGGNRQLVTEEDGRALLRRCSFPLVRGESFDSPDAIRLGGLRLPVVVKVIAADVSHKAKLGGVRIGCISAEDAVRAGREVVSAVQRAGIPASAIQGIRVEEQVRGPELLVGLQRDRDLGVHLTLGLGGSLTEAANLTRTVMAPVTHEQIVEELKRIRLWRELGERADAVAKFVLDVTTEFHEGELAHLEVLEMNPVIVTEIGPQIADVLAVR